MGETEVNIHALDAAYKPFPTFAGWQSKTSVDTVRWDRYQAELHDRPGPSPQVLQRAHEIVKRAAAIDTGAIEGLYEVDRGFTYTVAFETTSWELELARKGENVRPLFEAQLEAYDYVLDLSTKAEPISEAAIRKLHEVVCRAQQTYRVMTSIGPQEQELIKGRYKVLPNHVRTRDGRDHSYAPVDVTPPEMARLVAEMRGEAFLTAHPVSQAAYAHYCLVVVHPFADGNGRVARALASAFTYRAISMPIMILSEYKGTYLDALEGADEGDYQRFADFMMARSLDTIELVEESLRGAASPSAEESLAAIDSFVLPESKKGKLVECQVDEVGKRLLTIVEGEMQREISKIPSERVSFRIETAKSVHVGYTPTHRATPNGGLSLHFHLTASHNPGQPHLSLPSVFLSRSYDLLVPKNGGAEDEVQLRREDGKDMFASRIEELAPSASGILQIRASMFAKRVINEALSDFRLEVERSVRRYL
jgi:Fic family protein